METLKQHLPSLDFLAKARSSITCIVNCLHAFYTPARYSLVFMHVSNRCKKLPFLFTHSITVDVISRRFLLIHRSSSCFLRMCNVGMCHLLIKACFYVEGNKSIFCISINDYKTSLLKLKRVVDSVANLVSSVSQLVIIDSLFCN